MVLGTQNEARATAVIGQGRVVLTYQQVDGRTPVHVISGEIVVWSRSLPAAQAFRSLQSALTSLTSEIELVRQIPGRSVFLLRATGEQLVAPSRLADRLRPLLSKDFLLEPNIAFQVGANQDFMGQGIEQSWALRNVGAADGLSGKTPDADVDGMEALTQIRLMLAPPVVRPVVAVLDTGLDMRHPSLTRNLWLNVKEIAGNGIDDDKNGFIDDLHGADFLTGSGEPWDFNGHGTHVAGLIAAVPPQQLGAAYGLAPWALIMPLRILDGASPNAMFAPLFSTIDAMTYARAHGVAVINMSFESYATSRLLEDEVRQNWIEGIDQVAAAGNGVPDGKGRDLNERPVYPCVLPFVICVAATDPDDKVTAFSNFGAQAPYSRVARIGAPGLNILSTWLGGTHNHQSGTSMATPMVAAVLADIRAMYPKATYEERVTRLQGAADRPTSLRGKTLDEKRLNAYQTLFGKLPASSTVGEDNEYCAERVYDPMSGNMYPRSTNYPYANSNEPEDQIQEFMICTPDQLMAIQDNHLSRSFGLAQDIAWATIGPRDIAPIGARARKPGEPESLPFTGRFNGHGYAIVGMQMERHISGLFGLLAEGAIISNLRMREVKLKAFDAAGALAVDMTGGLVIDVEAEGTVEAGHTAGGLVAKQRGGALDAPFFSGSVIARDIAGGIVGRTDGKDPKRGYSFRFAYFSGSVQAKVAGGLAGAAENHSTIDGHALGVIRGSTTGGLAGALTCGATLKSSYAVARVLGTNETGGIVGRMNRAWLVDAYADAPVNRAAAFNGGAVGRMLDSVTCHPSSGAPKSSQLESVFFNSNGANPASIGTPMTVEQLRDRNSFPVTWRDARSPWRFAPGFMPALNGLARSFDFKSDSTTGPSTD